MSQSEEHIRSLLRRFADNHASGAEITEMIHLLRTEEGDATLESFIMELRGEATDPSEPAVDWETVWGSIQQKTQPAVVRKLVWIRVAAAAVILLLLSLGGYLYFKQSPQKQIAQTQQKRFQNDVAPGGNKAILTLSNGTQIILDSAAIGTLTQQGNTKIIKLDSGKLAYNSLSKKSGEVLYNTITTPRGGQYQLVLADGSKVWLNAASSLKYPTSFTGKERNVELTGEGYFEIAKNAAKPFHVKVNDMTVEVLGTHFNINAYDDETLIKTTLLEGSVKVSLRQGDKSTIIKPGEQALIENHGNQLIPKNLSAEGVIKVQNADIDETMAWKSGLFQFESADLKTILRQFARWYDVEIVYAGNVTEKKYFCIVNKNTSLSNVLRTLQAGDIKFRIEGKKLFVQP